MSMNLHCNKFEMQQTPTWVTYMIMMRHDGKIDGSASGNKAKRAVLAYRQWFREQFGCGPLVILTEENKQEHEWNEQYVEEHDKLIEEALNSKGLKVWVM